LTLSYGLAYTLNGSRMAPLICLSCRVFVVREVGERVWTAVVVAVAIVTVHDTGFSAQEREAPAGDVFCGSITANRSPLRT